MNAQASCPMTLPISLEMETPGNLVWTLNAVRMDAAFGRCFTPPPDLNGLDLRRLAFSAKTDGGNTQHLVELWHITHQTRS